MIILDSRFEEALGPARQVVAIGLISAGCLVVVTFFGYWLVDSSMGGNPWLKRQLKRSIARRPAVFVDANDPEALFVEIVPKANWGKTMFENASDVGLLVVDRDSREIRFEGDKERFRIPVASIMSCEMEPLMGGSQIPLFFMVVQARYKEGVWEAPIRERFARGGLEARKRKRAERLCQAVWGMMWR